MNQVEFNHWLDEHRNLYPSIDAWLDRLGETRAEGVLQSWQRLLSDIPVDDAKEASLKLYEAPTQPRGYEGHAREVKKICGAVGRVREEARTRARFGGVETVSCPLCQDTGQRSIYCLINSMGKPYSNREMVDRAFDEGRGRDVYSYTVRCTCPLGARFPNWPLFRDWMYDVNDRLKVVAFRNGSVQ